MARHAQRQCVREFVHRCEKSIPRHKRKCFITSKSRKQLSTCAHSGPNTLSYANLKRRSLAGPPPTEEFLPAGSYSSISPLSSTLLGQSQVSVGKCIESKVRTFVRAGIDNSLSSQPRFGWHSPLADVPARIHGRCPAIVGLCCSRIVASRVILALAMTTFGSLIQPLAFAKPNQENDIAQLPTAN